MPDRESIRRSLIEILEADTGQQYPHLSDTSNLREELGLDSVDVVSMVMQIECRFRIRLAQEELEKVVRIGDLLDLLERKLATASQSAAA